MFRHIFTRRAKKAALFEIDPEDVFLDSTNLSGLNKDQFEGHLEKPISLMMNSIVIGVVFLLLCGFSVKLFALQVVTTKDFQELANNNHLKSTPLFAHRGTILDRNGVLLAWNESDDTHDEIPRRVYIARPGFSHLLGYVSYPKKDQSGIFWQDDFIGRDGVEKQYQSTVAGVKGERLVAVNARGEIESENTTVQPINGENITLTIDAGLQEKLYESIRILAERAPFISGAGVVMNLHTGEVLAITSYPEYDNNLLTNASSSEDKARIARQFNDSRNIFLNRAVGGVFTPGSTVKPFLALAALIEDIIPPEKHLFSAGQIVIKNKYGGPDTVFKDWKPHGYVDMREAIAVSSDEYFYQVGGGYKDQKGLGIDAIHRYATMFGFGVATGIDLPGEVDGLVPSQEWKQRVFKEDWLLGNTYHTSIGQYGFQVTPIELARAVASLGNGGFLVSPHVLKGKEVSKKVSLSLNPSQLRIIQEGMRMVVQADIGTAKLLRIDGVDIAAKTGTAELGVSKDHVNSLVTAYFPYEKPEYVLAIVMERAKKTNTQGSVFAARDTIEWMRDHSDYLKEK